MGDQLPWQVQAGAAQTVEEAVAARGQMKNSSRDNGAVTQALN